MTATSDRAATSSRRPSAFLAGIRPYGRALLRRDVIAGVTLASVAIQEVLGYGRIAGVPVIAGLYTILLPAVAFALLGSSRHLVVGGDSATAAILYAGIAGLGVKNLTPGTNEWLAYASLAALITGALLLIARLARLGFLANFISRTVLVGFLTGVGIQVALGQLPGLLGVPSPHVALDRVAGTIVKAWDTIAHIGQASAATVAVSACVIVTIVVFDRWIKVVPGALVAVVGSIAISWYFDLASHGVSILGPVPSGFPALGLPKGVGWSDVVPLAGTSLSMVLVILAQSAATSRAYAEKHDESVDDNGDLLGLTVANLVAGLSSAFVVNGSPTKTEIAEEAGSQTQVTMLTMAAMTAIVLLLLTKPLEYLPNAVLAAVVFVIGIRLVDVAHLRDIARVRRDEFVIAVVTAIIVVGVGVEQGIILAIVLSLLEHIRRHYSPRNRVVVLDRGDRALVPVTPDARSEPGLVIYRFAVGVFFANSPRLSDEILGFMDSADPPGWIILLAEAIDDVDFTGGATLMDLARRLREHDIVFAIAAASAHVCRELEAFGLFAIVPREHVYTKLHDARAAFHASQATPS
jgi:high affinity sulfate transporter 1